MRRSIVLMSVLVPLTSSFSALATAEETVAERKQRIQSMSAEEKNELIRLRKRFQELNPTERERLRQLHEQISLDPRAEKLRETLRRYNEWLQTLDPILQAELQGLSPRQRVARIRELRDSEETRLGSGLKGINIPRDDLWKIRQWMMGTYLSSNQAEILSWMPPEFQRIYRSTSDIKRKRFMLHAALSLRPAEFVLPLPNPAQTSGLMRKLSPEARHALESDPEILQKLTEWFELMLPTPQQSNVSDQKLRAFYKNRLTDQQRQEFDDLPADEQKQRLQRLYKLRIWMDRARAAASMPGRNTRNANPPLNRSAPNRSSSSSDSRSKGSSKEK